MPTRKTTATELPRGVSIRQTKNGHGKPMWRVRLGLKFTHSSVVHRNFPTLEEAQRFVVGDNGSQDAPAAALRSRFGSSVFALSPRELTEAHEALSLLKSAGEVSLLAAVRFYMKHSTPAVRISLQQAIDNLIRAKETAGRSLGHLSKLRRTLEAFARFAKTDLASDVTASQVEDWLASMSHLSGTTRANAFRDIRILVRFCLNRGWMLRDPLAGVERPRADANDTEIITPGQAAALLAAASRDILPSLAIKLFTGLRSTEVYRLDWQDVTETHVIVRAANAKTRSRRVIEIAPNLAAWLKPIRQTHGPIAPMSVKLWHRCMRQAAKAADRCIEEAIEAGVENPPAKIGRLPQNFARHSFGTYYYALHQDEAKTAAVMGNSPAMIHRHYRALATAAEAKAYFGILPSPDQQEPAEAN
jgi:site-specific recombinase XerD